MEDKNDAFTYTYSAREQEEIRKIREKYAPPEKGETTLQRLRALDGSATKWAAAVSVAVGAVGALLLGVGMCCAMLPGWERFFLPGIAVGVLGIAGVIAAYPLYTHMVRRRRAKLAPEILRLADELLK